MPVRAPNRPVEFDRDVLPFFVLASGLEVLHASAVLFPAGVAVFCAASGVGKTTLALGVASRGHRLWADDSVAIQEVSAIPMPFAPRLRRPTREHLGDVKVGTFDAPAPLAALFVLRRDDSTSVRRLAPPDGLAALLPHAWCFSLDDEGRKREMMGHYLDLVARVPVFALHFEAGFDRLDAVIDCVSAVVPTCRA